MSEKTMVILDGNEAAASVAYRLTEVVAIYPITPSSPMAEWADQWRSEGKKNIWGALPIVEELQSEGGAAGALHGALQAGAFGTTFTASQGLLLMIPNMFKIAGELTPATMHVTARTLATHALSIFGDHSDVMACAMTGWAMLASNSVQEVADLALVAQIATLESRIPFIHFFDGFRTSHEVGKILPISDETIRAMVDDKYIIEYRQRALSPDRPIIRGTAQNPDVFFQAREACTPFHKAVPGIVQQVMDRFAVETGRSYHLFDYYGAPDAERVIVLMGSGAEAAEEAVDAMVKAGEKVGMVKVRLYRPFDSSAFLKALPSTVKSIAVLDRCKEPGATGEPLYMDIVTVLAENEAALPFAAKPTVVGGRYGLSSKEFTPAMVKGIFDELTKSAPKNHFTIGI
ncbi:MAG TPA: pyruvate:ferredoxin (flavodoxin) oxidoreductase, partial [Terracidiphilus sp.]